MYLPRSLPALAFLMSLSILVEALVSYPRLNEDVEEMVRFDTTHLGRGKIIPQDFEKRQDSQDLECPNDRYQEMLDRNPPDRVVTFCNEWLGLGPATKVVEWTPTITVTTSAASTTTTTSTTRLITTDTTTQTVTTTVAPVARRAANLAAVAEDIIHSVIASGTTEAQPTSKNSQRLMAESGLANACSCKMVNPTATVTSLFTVPPIYTTVGYRRIVRLKTTDTKVFTAYTTLYITQGQTILASTSDTASTGTLSLSAPGSTIVSSIEISISPAVPTSSFASSLKSSSSSDIASSMSPIQSDSITTSATPTTLVAQPNFPSTSSSLSSLPVVTAIPFSCPEAADQRVDQVVGEYRLDYLVLCNTELITQDRVGRPIPVESETSCAAQCSLVNAKSGQDTCQAASFQPYTDGRRGGTCTLSGSETEYVDKPGSVAVVHTGTYSNGDECRDFNSTDSPSRSVDTSALISSITAVSFSLSTPGLVTQSAEGGVFETRVYANSTDSDGAIHWSWYAESASSSYWWAVYSTSWECTATISRTIVQQPAPPGTITQILITTIINGVTTTIISGTSTRVFTKGGGGINPPTFVPASTTEGNGEFTTWFTLATQTSTGASSVVPTSSISSSFTSDLVSTVRNADNATVSGATSTFTSSGGIGLSPPLPSNSTITASAASTAYSISNATLSGQWTGETGDYGSLSSLLVYPSSSTNQTVTDQSGVWISAGSTFASTSTGTAGVITPTIATGVSTSLRQSIEAISSSSVLLNVSLSILTLAETHIWSTAGSTATTYRTWASGVISPVPSVNSSFITLLSVTSVRVFTTALSTFTSNATGDSGVILPTSVTSIKSFSNMTIPTVSSTQSSSNLSITGSVAITSASHPFETTSSLATQSLSTSLPAFNSSTSSSISVNASTSSTSTLSKISPSSANISSATSTVPDIVFTSIGGTGIFPIQGSTAVTLASSDSGTILPLPSSNSTLPTPTTISSSSSLNITSAPPSATSSNSTLSLSTGPPFTNSDQDRTRGLHSTSTSISLASTGIIMPSSNASVPASSIPPTESVPIISTSQTGPPFSNSDRPRTGSFNESSSSIGTPYTSNPQTSSTIASVTPSPSLNASSTSTGPGFSNSDRPRTGSFNESTSSESAVPPSATPSPSSNTSTTSTGVPFSNSDAPRTPNFNSTSSETGGGMTVASVTPRLSVNASTTFTSPASSGVPSSSSNSTSAPLASTSSSVSPTSSPIISVASSSLPSVSVNSTSNLPTPTSSLTATSSLNSTSSVVAPSSSGLVTGTTLLPNSTGILSTSTSSFSVSFSTSLSNLSTSISTLGSSSVSLSSSNSIASSGTGTSLRIVSEPRPSSNITIGESTITPQFPNSTVATGSGFTAASISNPTNSLNSSMATARTRSNATSFPTATPSVMANLTTGFASSIPSASPSVSFNATTVSSLFPGNSTSHPSATPTPWLNSTTTPDICPTAAVVFTVNSVQIAMSIQLQTVTVVQTQIQMVTVDAAATPASVPPTPSPSAPSGLESRLRRPGSPATQEQINAACADANNLVLNPNYAAGNNGQVLGWSSDTSDQTISVSSEQTPTGNSTMAEFKSAIVGRSLSITQPLVLCPKQQYTLSALTRQANALAKCSLAYTVGDDSVLTVTPQEGWLESSAFFTAGDGVEGASVDLKITASCAGYGGLPVADQDGWMRVEVGGIIVVRDVER